MVKLRSLGTRLVLFFVALLVLVQGLGAYLVLRANSQVARQTMDQELEQGERVFRQLLAQNRARLEQGAAILSADFAFREAVATANVETLLSVLRNHGGRVNADVMTLVGLDGRVAADTTSAERVGQPFAGARLVEVAAAAGKASAIVPLEQRLYQLVVVPVMAPDVIAYVGLAFEVDDAVARELHQLTGLEVSFLSRAAAGEWRIHASTLQPELRDPLRQVLLGEGAARAGVRELEMAGDTFETRLVELAEPTDAGIVAALQKPLSVGLAPFRRISEAFFFLTAAGLVLLVVGTLLIARTITRPVQRLAEAAGRVQQGDYSRHPAPAQRDEIGQLAVSFNHMLDGIESREREILRLAYEDGLTGLPNRAMFNEQLEQAVRTARRTESHLSVLLFDMDRFKAINDTLGHPVGDQALREVAVRVREALRDSDIVARLGGDEFAILLATGGTDLAPRVVAEKIQKALERPFVVEGQPMDITASIGIARFPEHGDDGASLMRAADVAMYTAKRNKSGFAAYDPAHDERRQEFLTMLGELRHAVESGELLLHYQPKMHLAENRVSSVEALVRWRHPQRGFVPPADFVPFAEQTGYISAITRWVLEHALDQAGRWHREGLALRVSVNISARDLRQEGTLVAHVAEALRRNAVAPAMLCLEITESGLMDDPRSAQKTLRDLRELGVVTSIDDYGTGYSSLAYIKQLAVNEIKIDRAFVGGMEADRRNAAIVRSTIELGHNLGLVVVAEGVETDHEVEELRRFGCDVAQGYHFARPMDAEALERWLRASREGAARAQVAAVRDGG